MCASSVTKVWLIKEAVCSSLYDSASSRAHAPHAGAALKSTSKGRFVVFASARAASASLVHLTSMLIVLLAVTTSHKLNELMPQMNTEEHGSE
jgi:hypothetical protein